MDNYEDNYRHEQPRSRPANKMQNRKGHRSGDLWTLGAFVLQIWNNRGLLEGLGEQEGLQLWFESGVCFGVAGGEMGDNRYLLF